MDEGLKKKIFLSVEDFNKQAVPDDLLERISYSIANDQKLAEEFRKDDLQYARDWNYLCDKLVGAE